ncbi:MAG: glycosyltransferase, partial [Planctomycetota bacterium]
MTETTGPYWPGVSVIIPAHNAETTLADCLRSVFETEYAGEVEVIVVDDASTSPAYSVSKTER